MNRIARKQRGAVLIVALVMLLVLTLLGVSGMENTLLQEKMTGGIQDREIAFQSAEAALRDGESQIKTGSLESKSFPATCANGLCEDAANGDDVWETVNWSGSAVFTYGASTPASSLAIVSEQPKYIIERFASLPPTFGDAFTVTDRYVSSEPVVYRVTAKGFGRNTDSGGNAVAEAMVQSVYRQ